MTGRLSALHTLSNVFVKCRVGVIKIFNIIYKYISKKIKGESGRLLESNDLHRGD